MYPRIETVRRYYITLQKSILKDMFSLFNNKLVQKSLNGDI